MFLELRKEDSEFDNEKRLTERGNGRRVTIESVTIVLILISAPREGINASIKQQKREQTRKRQAYSL